MNNDSLSLRKMVEEAAETRVSFLKSRESQVREKEGELKQWMLLRDILHIEYGDTLPEGDIVIRVCRQKLLMKDHPLQPETVHEASTFEVGNE